MGKNELYKIGTVSKLLGIPTQTLRYFEDCGFVHPTTDEETGYRYYNAWDLNFLMESRYMRSLGFPNAIVGEMLYENTSEELHQNYANQEKALVDEIHLLESKLAYLTKERKKLETFRDKIGVFKKTMRKAFYFEAFRKRNVLHAIDKNIPSMERWIEAMPAIKATFLIPHTSIEGSETPSFDYYWGYSATIPQANEIHLNITQETQLFAPTCAVTTVFTADGEHTFTPCLIQNVLKPLWAQGYTITGDISGQIIARAHEPHGFKRYFEVWVPVA